MEEPMNIWFNDNLSNFNIMLTSVDAKHKSKNKMSSNNISFGIDLLCLE